MLIKFIKNAYHPRKRTYGANAFTNRVYDFYKGKTYDLPDDKARHHILTGEAKKVDALAYLLAKKPPVSQDTTALLKRLGLIPQPQPKIKLPIQNEATLKALKNKELVKNMTGYFSDKNIPVKDIANYLIGIMDYAIDIKDDAMIGKIAGDLQTLFRLTEYNKGKKNDR